MEANNKTIEHIIEELVELGICDYIGDIVTIQDSGYKIRYQNIISKDLFGNCTGEYCFKAFAHRDYKCEECALEASFNDGMIHKIVKSVPSGDMIKYLEITASPLRDSTGQIVACIEIAKDITEREKSEKLIHKSEERFRSLVESTSDWIWEVDEKAVYTYASPKVFDILGYRPEEVIGKTPFDLMLPMETDRIADIFNRIKESQKPFKELENTNIHKDGHTVILETSGVPIFDPSGTFFGYRGIDRDITERKQAEKKLQVERNRAQNYLDIAGVIIVAIDANQKVTMINREGCAILGYKHDDIIGKNWFDNFLPEPERERTKKGFGNLMNGKIKPFKYFENPVLTKSCEERLVEWNNTVLKDDRGNTIGTLSSGKDITERKKAEEMLKEAKNNLEIKVKERTAELSSTVGLHQSEITERKRAEEELSQSEEKYLLLLKNINEIVYSVRFENEDIMTSQVEFVSDKVLEITGFTPSEFVEQRDLWFKSIHPDDMPIVIASTKSMLSDKHPVTRTYRFRKKVTDQHIWVEDNIVPRINKKCNVIGMFGVARDITERKRVEDELNKYSKDIEDSNTALRVLLKQRENDKTELEGNILENIKHLVLPYITKLKNNRQDNKGLQYLDILESNLKEIISPFSVRLSSKYLDFTPKEVQIADLIKDGKQDKDIAEIFNLAVTTVKFHRQNIRKKLGIYGKRFNLRTHLLTKIK